MSLNKTVVHSMIKPILAMHCRFPFKPTRYADFAAIAEHVTSLMLHHGYSADDFSVTVTAGSICMDLLKDEPSHRGYTKLITDIVDEVMDDVLAKGWATEYPRLCIYVEGSSRRSRRRVFPLRPSVIGEPIKD